MNFFCCSIFSLMEYACPLSLNLLLLLAGESSMILSSIFSASAPTKTDRTLTGSIPPLTYDRVNKSFYCNKTTGTDNACRAPCAGGCHESACLISFNKPYTLHKCGIRAPPTCCRQYRGLVAPILELSIQRPWHALRNAHSLTPLHNCWSAVACQQQMRSWLIWLQSLYIVTPRFLINSIDKKRITLLCILFDIPSLTKPLPFLRCAPVTFFFQIGNNGK